MARISISSICGFLEGFEFDHPVYIGVDVHKRSFSVAVLRPDGVIKDWVTPADIDGFAALLSALPVRIGCVCYEAGPTGFGLARKLESAGIPVLVAAPSRVPRPVTATNKTDRLDCLKLAEYASSGLLRGIAIPTEREEAFRTLVRRRHQLTDGLRKVKQRIRALLLSQGSPEPPGMDHWGKAVVAALHKLSLPFEAKETLFSLLRELEFAGAEQRRVESRIRSIVKEQDEAERIAAMRSVPGVGEIVATTFAAEIFRPERFNRSQEVTAYLGLAPVMRQSGASKARGHLRPVGQQRLRSLLIEAAWVWRQKSEWAREFYNRILGHTGVPQKAIAALARKLAGLLWKLSLQTTRA